MTTVTMRLLPADKACLEPSRADNGVVGEEEQRELWLLRTLLGR
ncbi:hypothetical protein [Streptomyces sp. TRM68367]|nr:hypothetical protein [Streptomyces sp. TRM68367]